VKTVSRIAALCLLAATLAVWGATGANRGWTKTSAPVTFLDEVTGLEGIVYEERFQPGLDFVGAALLGTGLLFGISCFLRNPRRIDKPS
jgi:hypothetical protein